MNDPVLEGEHHKLHGSTKIFLGVVFVTFVGGLEGWWRINDAVLFVSSVIGVLAIEFMYVRTYDWSPFVPFEQTTRGYIKANLLHGIPRGITFVVALYVYGGFFVLAALADLQGQLVSFVGLWLGVGLLLEHLRNGTYHEGAYQEECSETHFWAKLTKRRRLTSHYLAMALIILATSLLPLFGIVPSYRLYADTTVFTATGAGVMILGGALDHYVLSRFSGPKNTVSQEFGEEEE